MHLYYLHFATIDLSPVITILIAHKGTSCLDETIVIDPFDPFHHAPVVSGRLISVLGGSAVDGDPMDDLDELLIEVGLEPSRSRTPVSDDEDLESLVAAAEATFMPSGTRDPRSAPSGESEPVPAARSIEPDPVAGVLASDVGAIVMPYRNSQAARTVGKHRRLFRSLQSRATLLVNPGIRHPSGVGSDFPVNPSIFSNVYKEEDINYEQEFRNRFPGDHGPKQYQNVLAVTPGRPGNPPRWKDKPGWSNATDLDKEFLLSLQLTGLAYDCPSTIDIVRTVTDPEIGFFSVKLPVHLHEAVLGPKPAEFFYKALIRRIRTFSANARGVFSWSREEDGSISLWGMLRECGQGSAPHAADAAAGRRFGLALLRQGLRPSTFSRVSDEQWSTLYGIQEVAFDHGWANGRDGVLRDLAPDMESPIEFDFNVKEFLPRSEIDDRRRRQMLRWDGFVARCGLPIWFGGNFLRIFLEVLVRDEAANKKYRALKAVADNPHEKRKDRIEAWTALEAIDGAIEAQLETLRFYRGSPEQFAALSMSRGRMLGTYCDSSAASAAKGLYEQSRDA